MRKLMSDAQRAAWHIVNSEKKKIHSNIPSYIWYASVNC